MEDADFDRQPFEGRDCKSAVAFPTSRIPADARMLPAQVVPISDGKPTDDWKVHCRALLNVPWGRRAVRQAIAIGQDADHETLRKFVNNPDTPVLRVDNAAQLVRIFVTSPLRSRQPHRAKRRCPFRRLRCPPMDEAMW
jgi:hypothetical protein